MLLLLIVMVLKHFQLMVVMMNDDDEFFLWYGWATKGVQSYFQPGPLLEIFTIPNLRHAVNRAWTCAEPEFRLSWMKTLSWVDWVEFLCYLIYFNIVYFTYVINKSSAIFKYCFFVSIIWGCCCSYVCNYYSSFNLTLALKF